MTIETLKQLLELGWPAIITFMFGFLAIQYITDQRAQIERLWSRVIALETKVNAVERTIKPQE